MSSAELLPLFPSATHPALPIAQRLLSTLRSLTAPGRGNDIRPEERAALVGVAALLGCERVQSNDLIESAAQKACSVSPAHFRSALAKSRDLLAHSQSSAKPSPSSRMPRPSTSSGSAEAGPSTRRADSSMSPHTSAGGPSGQVFETPRKRQKYQSSLDLSGLVRNTSSGGSPLKNSMTPRRPGADLETPSAAGSPLVLTDQPDGLTDGDEPMTPTKLGVNGQNAVPSAKRSVRVAEDYSAFMALRPGSGGKPTAMAGPAEEGTGSPTPRRRNFVDELRSVRKSAAPKRPKVALKPRKDWTYRETAWTSSQSVAKAQQELDRILASLDSRSGDTEAEGQTQESLLDLLLTVDRAKRTASTA